MQRNKLKVKEKKDPDVGRVYLLHDVNNQVVGQATTEWVHIFARVPLFCTILEECAAHLDGTKRKRDVTILVRKIRRALTFSAAA